VSGGAADSTSPNSLVSGGSSPGSASAQSSGPRAKDKVTLSGKGAQDSMGMGSVGSGGRYINEMWRVLAPSGRCYFV